jgi:hypothetical protein
LRRCRRWGLHRRRRLCLLHLPRLHNRLLLLLAIHVCHRIHCNVPMRVKGNAHAVWCRSPILSLGCTLFRAVKTTTVSRPGRGGRGGARSWMVDGWTTRTAVGANAGVYISANWTL